MTRVADRLGEAWVARYTKGLPPELAQRRHEEIRSDLHDHAAEAGVTPGQQLHVLGRVLWGIPADLSWRRAARAPRERRLVTGELMTLRRTTMVVFLLYALLSFWGAISMIVRGYVVWGLPLLAAAALIGLGILHRDETPRRSTVLLIVGAAVPVFTLYWMVVVFGPIWIALTWLAIASEPGRRTPLPAI